VRETIYNRAVEERGGVNDTKLVDPLTHLLPKAPPYLTMTLTLDPPAPAAPQPDKGHRCGVDMPMEDGVPDDIVPLTDAQKAVIKATAPVLAEHGETITRHFCTSIA
jgi:hypothetical protein